MLFARPLVLELYQQNKTNEKLGSERLAFRTTACTKVVLAKSSDTLGSERLAFRTTGCTKVVLAKSSDTLGTSGLLFALPVVLKLY